MFIFIGAQLRSHKRGTSFEFDLKEEVVVREEFECYVVILIIVK